jgi:transcriptional regulator NrdR family protein
VVCVHIYKRYTEAELRELNNEDMISIFMTMQRLVENLSLTCSEQKVQLEQVNQNMNLILEQLHISKINQFGRSSEKIVYDGHVKIGIVLR